LGNRNKVQTNNSYNAADVSLRRINGNHNRVRNNGQRRPSNGCNFGTVVTVNCTEDRRPGWPALGVEDAMTTSAVVALANAQDVALVPLLAIWPTKALHAKPTMKLVPVTVMVLPA
jgi:hypothetical protein